MCITICTFSFLFFLFFVTEIREYGSIGTISFLIAKGFPVVYFPLNCFLYLLVSCCVLGVIDCLSTKMCWLLVRVIWWFVKLCLFLHW